MTDSDIRIVAKHAVEMFEQWMQADGVFPDPEYDQMTEAMDALGNALGIDMLALAEEWRQHHDSLPR